METALARSRSSGAWGHLCSGCGFSLRPTNHVALQVCRITSGRDAPCSTCRWPGVILRTKCKDKPGPPRVCLLWPVPPPPAPLRCSGSFRPSPTRAAFAPAGGGPSRCCLLPAALCSHAAPQAGLPRPPGLSEQPASLSAPFACLVLSHCTSPRPCVCPARSHRPHGGDCVLFTSVVSLPSQRLAQRTHPTNGPRMNA